MHLKKYLAIPGNTQQALADELQVSQGLISQWLNWLDGETKNATRVTAERALEIEGATKGQVTRHDLRPDVFGPAPRKAAA